MKTLIAGKLRLIMLLGLIGLVASPGRAQEATPPPEPTLEQRVADLEAYVNNTARTPDVASKIAGPGPGHNAWQMVSTALVIFMTLPGLALVLRRSRARRTSSPCSRSAWASPGWSPSSGGRSATACPSRAGNAIIGDTANMFFEGVEFRARRARATTGSAIHVGDVPAQLRHHHAGADRRRHRRAHEVQRRPALRGALDVRGLFPFAHMVWSTTA
jgi:hypothetical protein